MLYSLWMDLKQSESITEKIYICANPPENVQERDTSKKKKKNPARTGSIWQSCLYFTNKQQNLA